MVCKGQRRGHDCKVEARKWLRLPGFLSRPTRRVATRAPALLRVKNRQGASRRVPGTRRPERASTPRMAPVSKHVAAGSYFYRSCSGCIAENGEAVSRR